MKILITTECYLPTINGVVISIKNLKRELIRQGHEVRILTLSESRQSYAKDGDVYVGSAGAEVIYPGARFTLTRRDSFLEELVRWQPEIIHSQSEFSTFLMARRLAKRLHIPIVHTYHTLYEDYTHYFSPVEKWGKAMVAYLTRATLKHVHGVIVPSEKIKALLQDYGITHEIRVIPTGIDIEGFKVMGQASRREDLLASLGLPLQSRILLSVGRLAKEKNQDELLYYLKRLGHPELRLVFVGDGPWRSHLEALVRTLDLEAQVCFAGMIPHEAIAAYYQLGEVFVSASNSETQGLTYYEALANGLPLLCRKDDCLKAVIEEGLNGWQYETFEQFEAYLRTLLDPQSPSMKDHAVESIRRRYSLELFSEEVARTYQETLRAYKTHPRIPQPGPVTEDLSSEVQEAPSSH